LPGQTGHIELKKLQQEFGNDVLDKSFNLKRLLAQKQVIIIPISEAIKRANEYNLKSRISKDKALDSIIVDKKVDKHLEELENGPPGPGDAIEIEVEAGGSGGGSTNENTLMSE
jgi:hypothetical protein